VITVTNSTISHNQSQGDGGGIWNGGNSTLHLFNVTLADNTADLDLNGTGTGGGIFNDNSSAVDFQNSLLADNLASDYDPERMVYFFVPDDCAGTLTSQNYNLVSWKSSGCTFVAGTNDQINVAAHLGPLQGNGGPTWTHALLPGSVAIDAGTPGSIVNPEGCADALGAPLTTDQRGDPRPAFGGTASAATSAPSSFSKRWTCRWSANDGR
jgi:hypothetical protein